MHLSTYESGAIPGVFVTLPSTEARFIIAMVEQLSALSLRIVRAEYTVSGEENDLKFLELVTMRIAENGYAVHGFDVAVARGAGGI
jgi:hypothetical protein